MGTVLSYVTNADHFLVAHLGTKLSAGSYHICEHSLSHRDAASFPQGYPEYFAWETI